MRVARRLGDFISRIKLARKIQLLLLGTLLPLLILFVTLLLYISSYNQQYDKIIGNAAEATRFSIDFKRDMDYKMYLIIAGNSTFEEQEPYRVIADARDVTNDLIANTGLEASKQRARSISKLLSSLEDCVRQIESNMLEGGHYDENIRIWENEIQINTSLIQSDVYEYSYHVISEMSQVRQQVSYDLARIMLISAILFFVLVVILIVLSFVIPNTIAKPILDLNDVTKQVAELLTPIGSMLEGTKELSFNDAGQPAQRHDEIGRLSASYNEMANAVHTLVNNLEEKVKERTQDLQAAKDALEENQNKLTLILNSTVEAIFGIDKQGNCTFCNASCIKMLGYSSEEELLGRNIHALIHHSRKDGAFIGEEDCNMYRTIKDGVGAQSEDEVFWRVDGTSFDVAYYSYPQYKDGEIVGAVVTFTDNTERKRIEEHIRYLSYHDSLTGLYNRMHLEDALKKIDMKRNLPISIIFGDLNGLKLTNDIFGHAFGDELIKKAAKILKTVCREEDIIARVGGDEFIILLPRTDRQATGNIVKRIRTEFSEQKMAAIKCSMSMGYDTKTVASDPIEQTMENAENNMYKEKTNERKNIDADMISTIMGTLHERSPRESRHADTVRKLSLALGEKLGLGETELKRLDKAAYMHDIGKVVLFESAGESGRPPAMSEEPKEIRQHAVVGFRILNLFDETLDIANIVFSHHERWDGAGYPKGFKEKEIPQLARIISIAETYERSIEEKGMTKSQALADISRQAGSRFDPVMAQAFVNMMKKDKNDGA